MLRPSRYLRAAEFPLRAPSTPKGVAPLPRERTTGANFDTDWARTKPARMARAAIVDGPMRLAVAGLASPDRKGQDRLLDLDGPVIFAANHHSHLDTPLLLTSIPEPWRHKIIVGAAADYFFGTRVTGAISALAIGAIPIERAKTGRKSADLAAELIDDGWSLLIYPKVAVALTVGVSRSAVVPPIWPPERCAGRAGARRRHGPDPAQGALAPPPEQHLGDLRSGDHPCRRREHDPLRRPDRA